MSRAKVVRLMRGNSFRMICAAIMVGAAGLAGSSGPAAAERLTGKQIKALLSGKTIVYWGKVSGTTRFTRGGSATYRFSSGKSETGRWWVSGNKYCSQYRKLRKGKASCTSITAIGGGK